MYYKNGTVFSFVSCGVGVVGETSPTSTKEPLPEGRKSVQRDVSLPSRRPCDYDYLNE